MRVRPISHEQTIDILTGPREIPADITARVEAMLCEGIPLVDVERFHEFVTGLMTEAESSPVGAVAANYRSVVTLGSCSIEMAWQQAGDLGIPRPRRLHEHNQSVLNTFDRVFAHRCTDPRDRILKPMFALQDGGKAHCVALADPADPRRNRDQATHNHRFAVNILTAVPDSVFSADEKSVIMLLVQQNFLGTALYRHGEAGVPLDEVMAEASAAMNHLRAQCPPDYADRFDDHLLVSYLADEGAHTQRARYRDAATGEVRPDVRPEDRFAPDGSETKKSLDRLFSEAPEDMARLELHQPKHLAVMRRLFPRHYE